MSAAHYILFSMRWWSFLAYYHHVVRFMRLVVFRVILVQGPPTASKIATRQIGPKPRKPWAKSASASMEGLPHRRMPPVGGGRAGRGAPSRGGRAGRGASGRGGRARQRTKRDPPLGGAEGNNYRRTGGFGNLPGADMDNSTWTMEQLNEFLSVSKPLLCARYTVFIRQVCTVLRYSAHAVCMVQRYICMFYQEGVWGCVRLCPA